MSSDGSYMSSNESCCKKIPSERFLKQVKLINYITTGLAGIFLIASETESPHASVFKTYTLIFTPISIVLDHTVSGAYLYTIYRSEQKLNKILVGTADVSQRDKGYFISMSVTIGQTLLITPLYLCLAYSSNDDSTKTLLIGLTVLLSTSITQQLATQYDKWAPIFKESIGKLEYQSLSQSIISGLPISTEAENKKICKVVNDILKELDKQLRELSNNTVSIKRIKLDETKKLLLKKIVLHEIGNFITLARKSQCYFFNCKAPLLKSNTIQENKDRIVNNVMNTLKSHDLFRLDILSYSNDSIIEYGSENSSSDSYPCGYQSDSNTGYYSYS